MFTGFITTGLRRQDCDIEVGILKAEPPDDEFELTPDDLLNARERRLSRRYPIQLPAELSAGSRHLVGTTVNISGNGLLMTCPGSDLKLGSRVKVQIKGWPLRRRRNRMLTLIIEGHIVRKSAGFIAVRRQRYHFAELARASN